MPDLSARDILDMVEANPGHDVYVFNPESASTVYCINVWEHGQHWHENLMPIMNSLYPLMGLDTSLLGQLAHPDTMFFSQYCLAKVEFWNEYFDFLDKYLNGILLLDTNTKVLHNTSADYNRDSELGYFPFILERLLSSFVLMNQHKYSFYTYQYQKPFCKTYTYDKLRFLKIHAIKYRDRIILQEWLDYRQQFQLPFKTGQEWSIIF